MQIQYGKGAVNLQMMTKCGLKMKKNLVLCRYVRSLFFQKVLVKTIIVFQNKKSILPWPYNFGSRHKMMFAKQKTQSVMHFLADHRLKRLFKILALSMSRRDRQGIFWSRLLDMSILLKLFMDSLSDPLFFLGMSRDAVLICSQWELLKVTHNNFQHLYSTRTKH